MRPTTVHLGVAFTFLCASAASVEAKLIRYEINGQQYSYSTNNHQQTREARRRIEAAKAAEAAKGRADTEAAANPLARLFGSPAQRESAEAQGRVLQVTNPPAATTSAIPQSVATETPSDIGSTSSVRRSRAGRRAVARRERAREVRQASLSRPDRSDRSESVRETKQASPTPKRPEARPAKPAELPASPEPARPVASAPAIPAPPPPVQAAPVQAAPPPATPLVESARPRAADGGSLSDFVNQVRKAPGEAAPRL